MIHLALKTGYSFRQCFGSIDDLVVTATNENQLSVGVADFGNTFSFYYLEKKLDEINKKNKKSKQIKPIYGIRLTAVLHPGRRLEGIDSRGLHGLEVIVIAKNQKGLEEIFRLTKIFYDNFYYRGQISFYNLEKLNRENACVIAKYTTPSFQHGNALEILRMVDYISLAPDTPKYMIKHKLSEGNKPFIAITNNQHIKKNDFDLYQITAEERTSEYKTFPQHVMSENEYKNFLINIKGFSERIVNQAINNTHELAEECKNIRLQKADMIKSQSRHGIEKFCTLGAKKRGVNITTGEYKTRYEHELSIIKNRNFDNYFIVVAEIVKKAKRKMLIGPGRGSAAGSLICYLMGITEVDPIKHGLLFERFIDKNRNELPDIDVDFPDNQRKGVIKQITDDYGEDQVKHIANLSRLRGKSAIGIFAKKIGIHISETVELKNSLIERPEGDARFNNCIEDTIKTLEVGKKFIKKFPNMARVTEIEAHPDHANVHASGIVICNSPIHQYAGVNSRDNIVMADKKAAEYQNLLKVDILGLRTLSILHDCSKMIKMGFDNFYSLPLNDDKVFELLSKKNRLSGIFQFEGSTVSNLTKKMGVKNFSDIAILTSIARPGAMQSGSANRYIKYRTGEEEPEYVNKEHKKITSETYGIIVYQEQMLEICRKIGGLSWRDVNEIRRATSKSLGDEFFSEYKNKFIKGALKRNCNKKEAGFLWNEIKHSGGYAFNKSHAVAYGVISYWTAYLKTYHPLEFLVCSLNNEKDEKASIKILRDAVENEGIKYKSIDPDKSLASWSVSTDVDSGYKKILGGLTNIKGIALRKAQQIINCRSGKIQWTPGLAKLLINPVTVFDELYPCKKYFSCLYDEPKKYGLNKKVSLIKDINESGSYIFIGKLIFKNLRDLNDYSNLKKREGVILKDHFLALTITIEDDTDSIMCGVGRFDYEEIGRDIFESCEVDQDYFVVEGEIKNESFRFINIKKIERLNPEEYEKKNKSKPKTKNKDKREGKEKEERKKGKGKSEKIKK